MGGEQQGKALEMIRSSGIVDWNSDVGISGMDESFLVYSIIATIGACIMIIAQLHQTVGFVPRVIIWMPYNYTRDEFCALDVTLPQLISIIATTCIG